MGRWSRRLALSFLEFAGTASAERVLDVGCGTGHLAAAVCAVSGASEVHGVDLSPVYVDTRGHNPDPRLDFRVGDACALDYPDGAFDRVLSLLVLHSSSASRLGGTALNTLRAGHLRLEPQVAGHAQEMFEVLRDAAIYEFENEPPPSLQWLERRYRQLETRRSPDGSERWLNWVIRLPSGRLAGYVQATVLRESTAYIAYELASRFWRQGIGSAAVTAVLQELVSTYEVHACLAVLKARNFRSVSLLRHLGFASEPPEGLAPVPVEPDEQVMYKQVSDRRSAG